MHRGPRWNALLAVSWVVFLVCGLVDVALYGWSVRGPHLQYVTVGLLAAGAAMLLGALFGFLFGIPRLVSSGKARLKSEIVDHGTEGPSTMPSTNLAEISDWLTKLLLGAGLVQLTHLGGPTTALVSNVARGLDSVPDGTPPSGAAQVAAGGILVLFSVLGFIMGYVVTTLWYSDALQHILSREQQELPPAADHRDMIVTRPVRPRPGGRGVRRALPKLTGTSRPGRPT
jgi:hypothetical protein